MIYNLSLNIQKLMITMISYNDMIKLDSATTNYNDRKQLLILFTHSILMIKTCEIIDIMPLEKLLIKKIKMNICKFSSYYYDHEICQNYNKSIVIKNKVASICKSTNYNKIIELSNNINMVASNYPCGLSDIIGNTTLYYACKNNFEDLVILLIKNGADPNAANINNYTPMMEASRVCSTNIIKILIDAGGDLSKTNNFGYNSIHFASNNILALKIMVKLSYNNNKLINIFAFTHDNQSVYTMATNNEIKIFINCCEDYDNTKLTSSNKIKLLNRCFYYGLKHRVSYFINKFCICFDIYKKDNYEILLFYAVSKNYYNVVKFLIDNNVDINSLNDNLQSVLNIAVRYKHHDITKLLINSGSNINNQDIKKNTSLHFAALNCDTIMIKILIDSNININLQNIDGNSALHIMCKNGDVNSVNLLVNVCNININLLNIKKPKYQGKIRSYLQFPQSSLDIAIDNNHYLIVKKLLDNGAKINTYDNKENIINIVINNYMIIFNKKKTNIIEKQNINNICNVILQACSDDLTFMLNNKNMVLLLSSQQNNNILCLKMLENKANVNYQYINNSFYSTIKYINHELSKNMILNDEQYYNIINSITPLHIALLNDNIEILQLLLNFNANPNIPFYDKCDNCTIQPIHYALKNDNLKAVQTLLNVNVNITIKSQFGHSVFWFSRLGNKYKKIKMLLKTGTNINTFNYDGRSILCDLINENDSNIYFIKLLLDAKININIPNYCGQTAMWTAVINNNIDIVKMFVEAGINVNHVDDEGRAVIWTAVEQNNINIVKMLVMAGTNLNITDNNDLNIIDYALKLQYIDIMKYLIDFKNDQLKFIPTINFNSHICVICLTNPYNILYLPCKHQACCNKCNSELNKNDPCPICKTNIEYSIVIYNT